MTKKTNLKKSEEEKSLIDTTKTTINQMKTFFGTCWKNYVQDGNLNINKLNYFVNKKFRYCCNCITNCYIDLIIIIITRI